MITDGVESHPDPPLQRHKGIVGELTGHPRKNAEAGEHAADHQRRHVRLRGR